MKFIGIDIAKDTFLAAYPQLNGYKTQTYTNDLKGVKKFISSISKTEHHCVLEATGNYGTLLLYLLCNHDVAASLVNPKQIKHFAKMMMTVTKTDHVDAKLIAQYGEKMTPAIFKMPSDAIILMKQKRVVLRQLKKQLTSLTNLKCSFEVLPYTDKNSLSALNKTIKFVQKQILELQADLSNVAEYEKYGKKKDVTHLACWAHCRREIERALDNDRPRAEKALTLIQELYAVERKAKLEQLTSVQIKNLRLEKSLPVINELGKWIFEEIKNTLPKSQIGKAFAYAYARWDALSAYLYDGNLKIDNNLCENALRGIAIGRKNYLFAGSHEAAQRAAMIYSFFAICKKHDVNPFQWLKHTLINIMSINHKNLKELYPQNYKNIVQQSNM